jgi:superfamily II DNA helicase RecQ
MAEAIYFALAKTNNTQIKLKEEQKEDIRQIVNARDVKSLIYQLLPSMFDYINLRKINISAVLPETIVISPLNALVGDQIHKLKTDMGVKAVVLRHDDHDQEMKGVY